MTSGVRHEWRVQYQRDGWTHQQQRIFQLESFAHRYIGKLLAGSDDLAPLRFLTLHRGEVGTWEEVEAA